MQEPRYGSGLVGVLATLSAGRALASLLYGLTLYDVSRHVALLTSNRPRRCTRIEELLNVLVGRSMLGGGSR